MENKSWYMIFIPDGQSLSKDCKFTKVDLTQYTIFYNLGCSAQQNKHILDSVLAACNEKLSKKLHIYFKYIFLVSGQPVTKFSEFPADAKAMVIGTCKRFRGLSFEEFLPGSIKESIYGSAI